MLAICLIFGVGSRRRSRQDRKVFDLVGFARDIGRISIGKPENGEPIVVRVGRYGPFIEQGDRRASLREDMAPDELTVEVALELLAQSAQGEEPLGKCPETDKPVF